MENGHDVQNDATAQDVEIFNHPKDRELWCKIQPQDSECVPTMEDTKTFANIQAQISHEFGKAQKLKQCIKFLRRCFNIEMGHENTPVSLQSFIQMTKWFGSFTKIPSKRSCIFLEQMNKLMSHLQKQGNEKISAFAGMIDQQQAEKYLRQKDTQPGAYLIRFSETLADEGGFALAVKSNATGIRHYQIKGDPSLATQGTRYNAKLKLLHREYGHLNDREREYADIVEFMKNRLSDVIEDNIYCLKICPNLPCNALFRGYD